MANENLELREVRKQQVLELIDTIEGCELIEFFTVMNNGVRANKVRKVALRFGGREWETIEVDFLKGRRPWRGTNHIIPIDGDWLYKFFDDESNLLYIGKTSRLSKRLANHFAAYTIESEKSEWKYKVRAVEVAECNSKAEMHIQEMYMINKLKPPHNKDSNSGDSISFNIPLPEFTSIWFYRDWM